MHETSALGWYTGMTQRDGMGREVGGSGWGTHVNPWLIHVNVWQKPLQYCKAISLQLIKIIGKKKINLPTEEAKKKKKRISHSFQLFLCIICLPSGNKLGFKALFISFPPIFSSVLKTE